jgi:hypothetical protein
MNTTSYNRVISYSSPSGYTIDLTERQVAMLRAKHVWPRDSKGQEYCTVSHGLHETRQTIISDRDLMEISR